MITIDYFSDVLCVWAYGGQVRLDKLRESFGEQVLVREHFMSLFADTQIKIGQGWESRGGFEGFGRHAIAVCEQWPHAPLHADVWTHCRPSGSSNAHLFLHAVALCLGVHDDSAPASAYLRFHEMVARVREAFFRDGRDVSRLSTLAELVEDSDPGLGDIQEQIECGAAAALLHRDVELAQKYGVRGSPTYVFNEGRQMLFGNVGYRIIDANIRELLAGSPGIGEPSWC